MKRRIINAPTTDVLEMLKKRMPSEPRGKLSLVQVNAIGLIMVSIPDLYFYADLAAKSAHVVVSEIFGSCPQHVTTLAIFGDVSAVKIAMETVENETDSLSGF